MNEGYQYYSTMEEDRTVSGNGSDFAQSDWSYLNYTTSTEKWTDDPFMGSVHDPNSNDSNAPVEVSHTKTSIGHNLERDYSLFTSSGAQFNPSMSPSPSPDPSPSSVYDIRWASNPSRFGDSAYVPKVPYQSETRLDPNDPWNPLGQMKVNNFDRGYVAFVDSPKSSSDQSTSDTSLEADISPQKDTIDALSGVAWEGCPTESLTATNQQPLQWEPVIVGALDPPRNDSVNLGDRNHLQRKGRYGPLDPRKAQDARVIRKMGACWPCRVSKIKCSPGNPCRACQDQQFSMWSHVYRVCCRSDLADFDVLYFPAILVSHFKKEEVKSLLTRNIECFLDPSRAVMVHCGKSFAPMELSVHFFKHKADNLLNHHHFNGPNKERALRMIGRRCAPVAILSADISDLKKQCLSYIESMVSNRAYAAQVTAGENIEIHGRALELVHEYSRAKKNPLLDKTMKLHAMQYFMSMMLTFTKDSAYLVKRLSKKHLGLDLSSDVISSRLLTRQVKYVMHILHRKQTKTVLQEFESHLKKREQTGWPISFCVVIIVCLCTEEIQTALRNFIFTDAEISQGMCNESYKACRQLEDNPYRQYTQLFHDMYRSFKQPNTHSAEPGFNPISQNQSFQTSWDQTTQNLIDGIRRIISDSEEEMRTSLVAPTFDERNQYLDDSPVENHPARLLSKFLLSFLDDP